MVDLSLDQLDALKEHHLLLEYDALCGQSESQPDFLKQNTARNMFLLSMALKVHVLLQRLGVKHCFLKGPVLAAKINQNLNLREMKDIDILVPLDEAERVVKLLMDNMGAKIVGKYSVKQMLSWNHECVLDIDGLPLEVHWRASPAKTTFRGWELPNLKLESVRLETSRNCLPVLPLKEDVSYLTYHGGKHQWYRLCWLLDWYRLLQKIDLENSSDILCEVRLMKQQFLFSAALHLVARFGCHVDEWQKLLARSELKAGAELADCVCERWELVASHNKPVRQSAFESLVWTMKFQPYFHQKIHLGWHYMKNGLIKRMPG